jgi:hypothetical protein
MVTIEPGLIRLLSFPIIWRIAAVPYGSKVEERVRIAPIDRPFPATCTRTVRLKVRPGSASWLRDASIEVNQVWNWANELSAKAARPYAGGPKWLSGFDLCNLSAGGTEYALKRKVAKRAKLRWRVSREPKRSLGWVPFKAASLRRKGQALRFCGKSFRVFDREYLADHKFRDGCFAQDAIGDWYLCIPVQRKVKPSVAPSESVGIDLGLKSIATTSDGDRLEPSLAIGRRPMRTGSPWPSVTGTGNRRSEYSAKPRAVGPMRCISSRGRWSINITTS